jgi:hypothetical protein
MLNERAKQFIPREIITHRRGLIEKVAQRVKISPDQMQARQDTLDVAELIFNAKPVSYKA